MGNRFSRLAAGFWVSGALMGTALAGKEPPCPKKEIPQVRKAAEDGSAAAQNRLADWYSGGVCLAQNYREAALWYRKSADQGNELAQYHLGTMYSEGLDVRQDWAEAARWMRMSAEQNNSLAQFALGSLYDNGRGVEKDAVLAYQWIRLAGPGENHRNDRVLETMARRMTREQVRDAEERARAWRAAHPAKPSEAQPK
jgi:hypothetical protein